MNQEVEIRGCSLFGNEVHTERMFIGDTYIGTSTRAKKNKNFMSRTSGKYDYSMPSHFGLVVGTT